MTGNTDTNSASFMSEIELLYWPQSFVSSKVIKIPERELIGPARFSFLPLGHLTEHTNRAICVNLAALK